MNAMKILAAAVFATLAAAAYAQPYGPGAAGCAAGATPGTGNCPAYGTGPGAGHGRHGAGMQERLKAADTNADGLISLAEAQASLPGLAANFAAIDADKDGNISLAELQAARSARGGGQRGQGWKKWDANGDGTLTREEVANAPRLSQQFDAIDADHNGSLTVEELQAARGQFAAAAAPAEPYLAKRMRPAR